MVLLLLWLMAVGIITYFAPNDGYLLSVLEISLTQDEFQASESDGIMEVTMCRQQQIYSSVTVMISLVTSIDDVMIYEAALRPIPPSVQNSPNRAGYLVVQFF